MHSKSSNFLAYSGKVSCKWLKKNRVIFESSGHNTGLTSLFNFVTTCLAGRFTEAESNRPYYIRMVAENAGAITALSVKKPVSQPPITDSSEGRHRVVFSFIIENSDILNRSQTVGYLELLAKTQLKGDSPTVLARYKISDEDTWAQLSGWSATMSLMIDWQLEIANQGDTDNSYFG